MNNKRRIVIVGATSSMALHCARLWLADSSVDIVLIGRDAQRNERVAMDLRVRSPNSTIEVIEANFVTPKAIQDLVDGIVVKGPVDTVLIAHGFLPDQRNCEDDLEANHYALSINGLSPVLFAEAFVNHMLRVNSGTLAIIGSVAGDRGRKSNYVYGAAKGMVTRYAQGLQHRLANSNVKIVLIKPGPTDTPMTAALKAQGGKLASVEDVAQSIVDGIAKGTPVIYTPRRWALIMMVIRHLPRFVFNKMNI